MQDSFKRKMMIKSAIQKIPLNGTFELTPLCNMNCKMCYIHLSQKELSERGCLLSKEQWISLAKECVQEGMLFLLLTGGEPFLRSDFKEIYTELKKLGLYITINSNGTLIDEKVVEWLKKDPPMKINLTLYGSNEEVYERLCGYKDGFNKALKAIDLLKDAHIPVNININVTKDNQEDINNILEIVERKQVTCRVSTYMFPAIRNEHDNEDARLSADESGRMRYLITKKTMSKSFQAYQNKWLEQEEECLSLHKCLAGSAMFWVTWNGKMTPCGLMNQPVTFPLKDSFKEAWKEIVEVIEKKNLPQKCLSCQFSKDCNVCMANVEAEGNTEYLCQSTKRWIELMKSQ